MAVNSNTYNLSKQLGSQDNPFYERVREVGFKVFLDHDASKLVSHLGSKTWNWKEAQNG